MLIELPQGARDASACNGLTNAQGQVFHNNCFFYGWPGAIGRFGDSGVGIFTGPGTEVWSAGLGRVFPLTERVRMKSETTFSNVLNHANLAQPNMVSNSSAFGIDQCGANRGRSERAHGSVCSASRFLTAV